MLARELRDQQKGDRVGVGEREIAVVGGARQIGPEVLCLHRVDPEVEAERVGHPLRMGALVERRVTGDRDVEHLEVRQVAGGERGDQAGIDAAAA